MKILITEEQYKLLEGLLTEGENKPTNPKLWSQCLAWARSRYKVCPSAYCNGAAAKRYKSKGGRWKKKPTNESEERNEASSPSQQAAIDINMKKKGIKPKKESFNEDLKRWFKEKWVRFGPDGKIRGDCARGSEGEGKPKCLPQNKAHSLGKKGRASAASRKRRQDPNPERQGKAKNVPTKSTRDKK